MGKARLPAVIGHRGPRPQRRRIRWNPGGGAGGGGVVEFDAKLTADGVLILMHDDTLDRTTNGHGAGRQPPLRPISAASMPAPGSAELGAAPRADAWGRRSALLAELGLQANIEIKPCPGREVETAAAVVDAVQRHWPADRRPGR